MHVKREYMNRNKTILIFIEWNILLNNLIFKHNEWRAETY